MEIKILTNYDNDNLYCVECKQKIRFLEKFGILYDIDRDGIFSLIYHLDCLPTNDNEEDIYLTNE